MCGIVGCLDWSGAHRPDVGLLRRMLTTIRHRGPDEFGIYIDDKLGMGSARLSIIDLSTGQQPICNEDESLWIVFNGEIFNYVELRADLVQRGHRFSTQSDTEVILHLYEELGPKCLQHLNGQFAIAIWDTKQESLFLARDRLGIRPVFYAALPQGLIFGSEIKAILLDERVQARLDPYALAQTFTFWAPLAPRTVFQGIEELRPGHYMQVTRTDRTISRYWGLEFPPAGEEAQMSEVEAADQLRELLSDATRLRLRADVTVGSYLSGGLDSTYIAGLIRQHTPDSLCTFSIAFANAVYDESKYQELATVFLGTDHRKTYCEDADIGRVLPEVIWHTEVPILRTSPVPMYLLSRLVRDNNIKVVLTGEGSDEFLGGYDIYKEDKIRRFWAREPESALRPLLLRRLYPYIANVTRGGDAYLAAFFGKGLTETDRPAYSHLMRWNSTARMRNFLSADLQLHEYDPVDEVLARFDGMLAGLSPLAQAQILEVTTFMSAYLLSSQGDRVMAANSVEGRFPFLDHRVVEFAGRIPPRYKIRGLREKHILKESAAGFLPPKIIERYKQPYRAPIHRAFLAQPLDYVTNLLSPEGIARSGVFAPEPIAHLLRKYEARGEFSEFEDMALVGVLSTQLLHHEFVENFDRSLPEIEPVRICRKGDGECRLIGA
ncbi:MAG: asparagine synthase (glutamine-hydrolyzing) [Anaerolineae bacterium]|nr:asparagine synthase (glutamine-hydrolyzing) [Anaerolineae bacterium]